EPRARFRRILSSPKRKRRCACGPRDREFHRDARQDRVQNISREKEARSLARSRIARNLSAALHDGDVYSHSLRASRASRKTTRPCHLHDTANTRGVDVDTAITIYHRLTNYLALAPASDI